MTANHTDYFVITHYTIYFIAISPILILAVVEIFIHLRRHVSVVPQIKNVRLLGNFKGSGRTDTAPREMGPSRSARETL